MYPAVSYCTWFNEFSTFRENNKYTRMHLYNYYYYYFILLRPTFKIFRETSNVMVSIAVFHVIISIHIILMIDIIMNSNELIRSI